MITEPLKQHAWLDCLVGDWTYEAKCDAGPSQPSSVMTGTESVRRLGKLWTVGEGTVAMPDGSTGKTMIVLGFDPAQNAFVGSWTGSMMAYLWTYRGTLDVDEKVLTLESVGPSFSGDGNMSTYHDIITLIASDHRRFTSRFKNPDGTWTEFMTSDYRRK